jgi:3-carboxy-cis,cis-muconate cycloisomerase
LTSSELFGPIYVPAPLRDAVSDRAWLQAMLDFEAALAAAEGEAGVIPSEAAEAIAGACRADSFDPAEIGRFGRGSGNPAAPLVTALTEAVGGEAAGYVHWGATSQDVVDSAAMLVSRGALELVDAELGGLAAGCAALAEQHRDTLMVARTLMQQALPTTFGLKAAGWLVSVVAARGRLAELRDGLPVQFGGAAGTLAPLGEHGPAVAEDVARRLGLTAPALPWHNDRGRVAELGSALAVAAGAVEKIALDVVLLSQSEVLEVAEPAGEGRGGSSTMPQKRNPVGSALAIACSRRVRGAAGVLLEAVAGEHERAAGAWQSEWEPLAEALALTGGAAAHMREVVEGLEVHPDQMQANLAGADEVMAESAMFALAERLGRHEAKRVIAEADDLREAGVPDDALDPRNYLGSAGEFVDRALRIYQESS